MPGAKKLINAYRIPSFATYHDLNAKVTLAEETPIVNYREYSYNFEIEFHSKGRELTRDDANQVVRDLKKYISGIRHVKSSYGHDYECQISVSKSTLYKGENLLVVELTGESERTDAYDGAGKSISRKSYSSRPRSTKATTSRGSRKSTKSKSNTAAQSSKAKSIRKSALKKPSSGRSVSRKSVSFRDGYVEE